MKILVGWVVAIATAVVVGLAALHAEAGQKKDTRYDIERELRTVADRSAVALSLMRDCNALPQCDPSADEMITIAVASVEDHAREAARLLRVYR